MPVRRAESLTTLTRAMSPSKQLGGFPTSGVFDFRQTRAHAPQRQAGLRAPVRLNRHFLPRHWQQCAFHFHRVTRVRHLSLQMTGHSGGKSAVGRRRFVGTALPSLWVSSNHFSDPSGNPARRCS